MFHLNILTGNPGCGKSDCMFREVRSEPGRYLAAFPQIELLQEQHAALLRLKPDLKITEAHSRAPKGRGSVSDWLHTLAETSAKHEVILTTHESLLDIDTERFRGWRLRIDEAPQGVASGNLPWSRVAHLLPGMFDLQPLGGASEWSHLVPRPDAIRRKSTAPCPLAEIAPDLRKFAGRPQGVLVKVPSWKAAAAARDLPWASVWSFEALRPFGDVTIASAGLDTNLMMQAALKLKPNDLIIHPTVLAPARTGQPTITIHYFTEGHTGSTAFWGTSEGRRCIVPIADYMQEHVPGLGYWAANDGVWQLLEHRFAGEMIGPKAIGINRLRHQQSCALIYSSKATPNDAPLQDLLGLSDAAFRSAREDEDVRQFVSRGAIRQPDYSGPYDVYVYSRDQAQRLTDWLEGCGFRHVAMAPVDAAGLMIRQRTAGKKPVDPQAALERKRKRAAERQRKSRAKKRAETQASAAAP